MANVELVTYETAVEKLCADWVLDVTKLLAKEQVAIKDRSRALRQKIASLQAPQSLEEKEFSKIPDRINEILKQESVRLKGVVDLALYVKADAKSKKVVVDGHSLGGLINSL